MPEHSTRAGALTVARRIAQMSVIALGFSIPISTALDNVLLALLALAWALSGLIPHTARAALAYKALGLPVLLFALLALGMAYGATPLQEAFSVLGKYADLMFIPVIACVAQDEGTRNKALYAYAAAIALTVLLSWGLWLRLVPPWPFILWDFVSPSVFKYKATHNVLVAFGAYVFLCLAQTASSVRWKAVAYGFAALAAANVLLLVNGATGYLMVGALSLLYVTQRFSGRQAALGIGGIALLVAVLVALPGPLHDRVRVTLAEISAWQAGAAARDTRSSELRMEAYYNTAAIIAARPLTGVGTGGFTRAYAQQVAGTDKYRTTNPHSEFLGLAVQLGAGGVAVLLWMLWAQWRAARGLVSARARPLAQGLVISMVLGCLVSSMLLDHTEGLFYAWFCGVLFGGLLMPANGSHRAG